MSEQHTDGPWVADEADDFGDHNIHPAGEVSALGVAINRHDPVLTAANARLIAAAPDLLAALTGLIEMLDMKSNRTGGEHDADVGPLIEAARAALARATTQEHAP